MIVAEYLANFLESKGINVVFEMSGGMITTLLDKIYLKGKIKIVSMHHEQSAAFAADAYGRIKNLPGIALATSGPGATNLLTGIGSCYFDSTPAIFITGQVNTHEQKGKRRIRQLGFQETDIVSMAKPITKKVYNVINANDFPKVLHEAFELCVSGRPGPVLIDLPMNIQRTEIDDEYLSEQNQDLFQTEKYNIDNSVLLKILDLIKKSKRPLILAGRGVHNSKAIKYLKNFIEITNIPVVASLLAVDVLPYKHELRVGFIGSYGNRWANIALGESDLLIVFGSRLDIRQTGADVNSFVQNKTIVHVDIEKYELNNRIKTEIAINSDLKIFLKEISHLLIDQKFEKKNDWIDHIRKNRSDFPDIDELKNIIGINPNKLISKLSHFASNYKYFIADVGNHQMWAAQSLQLNEKQRYFTSGGMGSMGFALPAAIGASITDPDSLVIVIAGDGGFQVNIQELETIVRNKLPIKILILNNNCLGMIRQFQDSYFEGRYQSTFWGYSAPNFEAVAKAYGIESKSIKNEEEIDSALEWFLKFEDTSSLLQVYIDTYTNVYPKLAFGKPITEMEPFSKPLDMEGT